MRPGSCGEVLGGPLASGGRRRLEGRGLKVGYELPVNKEVGLGKQVVYFLPV